MNLKFRYVLLIATDCYKQALVTTLRELSSIEELDIVVVINGAQCAGIERQYVAQVQHATVQYISTIQRGKSHALNTYIKTIQEENVFLIFTDDDIVINPRNIMRYIETVEANGKGYFYGGGVDVKRNQAIDPALLALYPASIRGVSEEELISRSNFLGCNWGAFASDIIAARFFNPFFGPGSITGSVGQESEMMHKLSALGIKRFPIANCRVVHYAPAAFEEQKWLYKRRFREGLQYGLMNKKKVFNSFLSKLKRLLKRNRIERNANGYYLLGLLYSLRFYFKKIT